MATVVLCSSLEHESLGRDRCFLERFEEVPQKLTVDAYHLVGI